jgi:hypothetical protein
MTKRFEIKFPIQDPNQIYKWKSYFNLRKTYPDRIIKSIYFDTKSLYLAQQNIDGFSSRFKIRERYYDNKKNSLLEIKNKSNKLVEKFFFKNFKYSSNNGLIIYDKLKDLHKYPKTFFFLNSNKFFKTSIVQYKREYYNVDENFRFTFDKNISFFNFSNNRKTIEKKFKYAILELKTFDLDNNKIIDYINKLNIYPKRFSKYVQSLQIFKKAKYY